MAPISLEQVTKIYPDGTQAVKAVDLEVAEGEFMVLVGPSGCGKTTLLRMIAGLEEISGGVCRIGGRVVNDLSPKERDIAMVFQNYALYPHMTVRENIGFALKLKKMAKSDIDRRVEDAARILGLGDSLERKPNQLSGGQRQRVAMGRSIVREPAVFLMDEPLSNLDAKLRVQMRAEVSRIQRRLGVATVYVTHDQVEALTMGDRVAVMRQGVLQQCEAPQDLYDHPVNTFVAGFIGSPAMNLYRAHLTEDGPALRLGSQSIQLPADFVTARPGLEAYTGREVVVGMRPEHLRLGDTGSEPSITAEVELVEALGSELLVHFSIDAERIRPEGGADETELETGGEGIARVDPRSAVKPGDRARFSIDAAGMQFFADDGLAVGSGVHA